MKCKLCLTDAKLCKSHVIPEFFFKPMYDDKHRICVVPLNSEERVRYAQRGPVENLLCFDCEQHISSFERYVSEFFQKQFEYFATELPDTIRIVNLDYCRFKLFQISVLWRASISALPTFAQVNLGPHEEKIRQMLRRSEAGPPELYPCMVTGITVRGEIPFTPILQPERIRVDSHCAYRFVFGQCMWVTVVSSHSDRMKKPEWFLQQDGTLLFRLRQAADMEFIRRELQRVAIRDDLP